jgi:hypothetical protein
MFINSILSNASEYAFPLCSIEIDKNSSWFCRMFSFWYANGPHVGILARFMLSTNPLLNGLIYAGFLAQYRARVIGIIGMLLLPIRIWRR